MKRVFSVLILMLLTISTCFALRTPRWNKRPIKVYIPSNNVKSQQMKSAFLEWQNKTYSAVWFTFLSDNQKQYADISVYFPEFVNCGAESAVGCAHYDSIDSNGFYQKVGIEIGSKYRVSLKGDNGQSVTKTCDVSQGSVYGIMLHEVGHALGINEHSGDVNSVMFSTTMYDQGVPQKLTQDDLRLLYKTYR